MKQRLLSIDVLKAVAIISVVLFHAGYLPFGYLGVDIFLVINGFFITKGLERKWSYIEKDGGKHHFWKEGYDFLWGRAVRLLPVLIIATLACMLWGYFVMLPDEYENLGESVVASNFFSNNILQSIVSKDYWHLDNNYKPLMHTWYIGILMEFYVFFFILYYSTKKASKEYDLLKVSLYVLGGASLLWYIGSDNINFRFYFLPCRFFEFAVGSLLYFQIKESTKNRMLIPPLISYLAYLILLFFLFVNDKCIDPKVKLLVVVELSAFLLLSVDNLEQGKISALVSNNKLALIGAASYSIYLWHQIVIAFTRYSFTTDFGGIVIIVMLLIIVVLSFTSYYFIEKKVSELVKTHRSYLFVVVLMGWIGASVLGAFIYFEAGVMRDVPELEIYQGEARRGMHSEYNESVVKYCSRTFFTDKEHWLILGNSFAKDWANIIHESKIRDSVEMVIGGTNVPNKEEEYFNYRNADLVFISSLGFDEEMVNKILSICILNGLKKEQLFIVGEKDFGQNNGQIYWKRHEPDYYMQVVRMDDGFYERNQYFKNLYQSQFVDLIGIVQQKDGKVNVFTDDRKFISQDTKHLTKSGAKYYAKRIDWGRFLKK